MPTNSGVLFKLHTPLVSAFVVFLVRKFTRNNAEHFTPADIFENCPFVISADRVHTPHAATSQQPNRKRSTRHLGVKVTCMHTVPKRFIKLITRCGVSGFSYQPHSQTVWRLTNLEGCHDFWLFFFFRFPVRVQESRGQRIFLESNIEFSNC